MSEKGRSLTNFEQVLVTGGAMLAAAGLATTGWGLLSVRQPWRNQTIDRMDCSPSWQSACDQLEQDNSEVSQGMQIVGDGIVLASIGGASVWLTFHRARNADPASSIKLPIDVEYYRLIEGSIGKAPGVPIEPSKNQL